MKQNQINQKRYDEGNIETLIEESKNFKFEDGNYFQGAIIVIPTGQELDIYDNKQEVDYFYNTLLPILKEEVKEIRKFRKIIQNTKK